MDDLSAEELAAKDLATDAEQYFGADDNEFVTKFTEAVLLELHLAAAREREACALQVRHDCAACEGSGYMDDHECEYCGRPMAAIRARTEGGGE